MLGTVLYPVFKKRWITNSGETEWAVLSAVKCEISMRAKHFEIEKPPNANTTEVINKTIERSSTEPDLYSGVIDVATVPVSNIESSVEEEFDSYINELAQIVKKRTYHYRIRQLDRQNLKSITCYKCNHKGHYANNCLERENLNKTNFPSSRRNQGNE